MTNLSTDDAGKIVAGTHSNPFSILGPHAEKDYFCIRTFIPGANSIDAVDTSTGKVLVSLTPIPGFDGLFEASVKGKMKSFSYTFNVKKNDHCWSMEDPYRFGPVLGEMDEYFIGEGAHLRLWDALGAHVMTHQNIDGVHFAVWAPNASRVSVIGNFNDWDGRRNCMRLRGQTGVWEIFIPGLSAGESYKFELLDALGKLLPQKADPFGFGAEHPPKTASIVQNLSSIAWSDDAWVSKRESLQRTNQPISIYEVHLGSWRRAGEHGDQMLSYTALAEELVAYAKDMGFTHIELMPVSEFPFDGSWGYQPIGLYAPTVRHGTPQEFGAFVEACHRADLGLILDWVPGHFPEDQHGLGNFDGTALYEHTDRREGFHPDWKTLMYNYGRREVSNFLLANALFWLSEYHIDGLRVDAVASMLYRDYSREDGQWIPNQFGGRENLEAIAFLQRVNVLSYGNHPGVQTIAEESTAFAAVTGLTSDGGLGFGYKWNMGWMNDTLAYMSEDPINRKYHHQKMTFGLHYAFSENFILPLSHDEVVHGKGSLLEKMPGYPEDKFANLRAYYGFMWGHPGKKLLFMGGEIAQASEWSHQRSLDWHLLDNPLHHGMQTLIRELNTLYRLTPALYELDCEAHGFEWVEDSADDSIFAWIRYGIDRSTPVLIVSNFTPIERSARRIGVPEAGRWIEKLNTDATQYGGNGRGNLGYADSESVAMSGRPCSLSLTLPPLTTLIFELESK